MKRTKIGIIGIKGRFGRWFEWFFKKHGYDVWGADIDTASGPKDIVKWAQVVVVCVPLRVVPRLIEAGLKDADICQLWIDISSVKVPVTDMLDKSRVEFVSMHPLFAPEKGLGWKGKTVVIAGSRIDRWSDWWKSFSRDTGARFMKEEALFHDTHMLGVQNGVHALALAHMRMCRELGLDPKALLELSTPISTKQLGIAAKMLSNNPEVFADIQLANPRSIEALDSMIDFLIGLRRAVKRKDRERIMDDIKDLREYLGESTIRAALKEFQK